MGWAQWVIWHPATGAPEHVDVIVVLAYGNDRLERGRELAAAGVSDVLVVSQPDHIQESVEAARERMPGSDYWLEECGQQYQDYLALCIDLEPKTTDGEAAALNSLAVEHGWDSIALVTERSHLGRSTMIFERCYAGDIYPVASAPHYRPDLDRFSDPSA